MTTNTVQNRITDIAKQQFCTFEIANRLYGVDILDVKEINSELEFTPVYHAPPEVKGYVNIRGQIHLIINLPLLLGFEESKNEESNHIVLFKPTVGESFGVLVDRIRDVVDVNKNDIEVQCSASTGQLEDDSPGIDNDLTTGVCRLDESLLVLLDAKKIFTSVSLLTSLA